MWRDESYLLDILIAARKAKEYIANLQWKDFAKSELHQDAIVRRLEIIGEAAGKISTQTKEAHPEIPWNKIVGMRNRLIHEYFRVDLQQVWDTVQNELSNLINLIEPLVPPKD